MKLKNLYFRTFQLCLKIALPFLPYRDPIIIDSISSIHTVLNKLNKSKVMIITDEVLLSLGLVDELKNHLNDHDIKYTIYSDVVANPTTKNVEDALSLYHSEKCDCLIAIGGGSVIDCAKGIGARIARKNKSLNQMAGILKVLFKIPTLIAIPTTAGTGSETTLAAVIVDEKTRHKYAISDFPLIPHYAVLDVRMILNLPKHITSTTGMDALTHAIEAYIGNGGNKNTRKDALEAIKLVFENLEISYNENTIESKKNMLKASHLAGRAFSKAYVGNVHALAHALGGQYNTAHGKANALLLPLVLEEYNHVIDQKIYEILTYCGIDCELSQATKTIVDMINNMNKNMDIINDITIFERDLDLLCKHAYKEANPLYPVPVIFEVEDFKKIYRKLGVK